MTKIPLEIFISFKTIFFVKFLEIIFYVQLNEKLQVTRELYLQTLLLITTFLQSFLGICTSKKFSFTILTQKCQLNNYFKQAIKTEIEENYEAQTTSKWFNPLLLF